MMTKLSDTELVAVHGALAVLATAGILPDEMRGLLANVHEEMEHRTQKLAAIRRLRQKVSGKST